MTNFLWPTPLKNLKKKKNFVLIFFGQFDGADYENRHFRAQFDRYEHHMWVLKYQKNSSFFNTFLIFFKFF